METTSIMLPEAPTENTRKAFASIKAFATSRKLVLTGNVDAFTNVPLRFSSKSEEKKFRWSLLRVTNRPSMKNINMFLSHLSRVTGLTKIKLDYSEQEKQIKEARKEWKFLQAKAEEARLKYKEAKGNFYK